VEGQLEFPRSEGKGKRGEKKGGKKKKGRRKEEKGKEKGKQLTRVYLVRSGIIQKG
jgi:hypothetical protein